MKWVQVLRSAFSPLPWSAAALMPVLPPSSTVARAIATSICIDRWLGCFQRHGIQTSRPFWRRKTWRIRNPSSSVDRMRTQGRRELKATFNHIWIQIIWRSQIAKFLCGQDSASSAAVFRPHGSSSSVPNDSINCGRISVGNDKSMTKIPLHGRQALSG